MISVICLFVCFYLVIWCNGNRVKCHDWQLRQIGRGRVYQVRSYPGYFGLISGKWKEVETCRPSLYTVCDIDRVKLPCKPPIFHEKLKLCSNRKCSWRVKSTTCSRWWMKTETKVSLGFSDLNEEFIATWLKVCRWLGADNNDYICLTVTTQIFSDEMRPEFSPERWSHISVFTPMTLDNLYHLYMVDSRIYKPVLAQMWSSHSSQHKGQTDSASAVTHKRTHKTDVFFASC